MRPIIRFDIKKNEYRCTNNIGGWLGFGKTPELSYAHYIRMNGGWDSYHLAA